MNTILEFRDRFNLTQAEMGTILNRGRQTISNWESGRTEPEWNAIATLNRLRQEPEHVIRAHVARMTKIDRGHDVDVGELANWILESDVATRARFASENIENPGFDRFTGLERGFARREVPLATLQRLSTLGLTDGGALTAEHTAEAIGPLAINGRLSRLGVSYVTQDNIDNFAIPLFENDPACYWLGEGQDVTQADIQMARVNVDFKTVAVGLGLSRQLMRLSGDAGLRAFAGAIVRSISREIDRVALVGTGIGPEPLGIANRDIPSLDATATTWDLAFWEAVKTLELAGVDSERLRIIAHPNTANHLRRYPDPDINRVAWLMENGRQTYRGFPFLSLPNFREGSVLVGDFSSVVVRLNSKLDMRILDSHRSDGGHEVYAFADLGIEAPRAAKSFVEVINVP